MIRRRTLTPPFPQAIPGLHSTRRKGARREISDRVRFLIGDREIAGWALNLSPGGLRSIVEEPLEPGAELHVAVGAAGPRLARIVWVQDEPDGSIVGVAFLDLTRNQQFCDGSSDGGGGTFREPTEDADTRGDKESAARRRI